MTGNVLLINVSSKIHSLKTSKVVHCLVRCSCLTTHAVLWRIWSCLKSPSSNYSCPRSLPVMYHKKYRGTPKRSFETRACYRRNATVFSEGRYLTSAAPRTKPDVQKRCMHFLMNSPIACVQSQQYRQTQLGLQPHWVGC